MMLFSGCASLGAWQRMKGEPVKVRFKGYEVTPPVDWMRRNTFKIFLLTKDGLALNQIAVDRKTEEVTQRSMADGCILNVQGNF